MNRSCGERILLRLMDLHPDCIGLGVNIFGYIAPALALFVTATNILIVIVFMRPHLRSHTTFILTLIACADILDIACPTTVFAYHYLFGHYKEFLTCREIEWTYILGEICADIFSMISLWLTVLLAYIRCRCIKSPYIARHVHSFKRIVIYAICILVVVISLNVPSFFIFEYQPVQYVDPSSNVSKIICAMLESDGVFFKSCSGRKVQVIMETLLDSILPCVILVYYNFAMFLTLRKGKQNRLSLRSNDSVLCGYNVDGNNYAKGEHSEQRKALTRGGEHVDSDTDDVFHTNGINIPSSSMEYKDKKFDSMTLCSEGNNNTIKKFICTFCYCFKCERSITKNVRNRTSSSDHTIDKLDRESRRTSWLILCVATMVFVHEFPLAVVNAYNLTTHIDDALPLSNGCVSIVLLFWQFVTYPAIFLIYACMSNAFRSELWKMITCQSKPNKPRGLNKGTPFPCPCSVRKTIVRYENTRKRHSHDFVSSNNNR